MVLALACEAVGAVEVAGVGYVKAEGLDREPLFPVVLGKVLVLVGNIELAFLFELFYISDAFLGIFAGDLMNLHGLCHNGFSRLGLVPADHVESDRVRHVNRAREYVEHDI